jgi:accessory gene regulator protein AgrB
MEGEDIMSWTEKLSIRIARKIVPAGESFTVGQVSHGIELFLLQSLSVVFLVTVSFLLGCTAEAISIAAIYMLLRNFTGGVHFKSALTCFLTGNGLILAAALVAKQLPADHNWFSSLFILLTTSFAFVINYHHAPAAHTYVTIAEQVRKKNRKIILFLLFFGCQFSQFLVYFDYRLLGHAFSFAVLLQSSLLHPLAYRAMEYYEKTFSRKD